MEKEMCIRDRLDTDEDWTCEARRYYFNIVGKYGAQVQAVLKKAAGDVYKRQDVRYSLQRRRHTSSR